MGSAVISRFAAIAALGILVAGCQPDEIGYGPKHQRPLSMEMRGRINDLGMRLYSPMLIRIFKKESTLEVWKRKRTGKYALLKSYEICKWSGKLGPKFKEGDRQAPEGFYAIYPAQMNPNSDYFLSFNLGFPNPYDRSHGRTGSHLMVHGSCSSRGCYAMEDAQIQEIYTLARDSFKGGQRAFQVQALPFRMTPENMAKHTGNKHMAFWNMLKDGYDHFEITKTPPKVDYCGKRYVFNAVSENESLKFNARAACPAYQVPQSLEIAVASKQKADNERTQQIVAELAVKRKRDAEWKQRETAIAEALGAKKKAEEGTTDIAGIDGKTPTVVGGVPVPRAAPRSALALAEEKPSETGSFFSGLFGDDDQTPKPPERVAATGTAPESPSPQTASQPNSEPVTPTSANTATPPGDVPAAKPADQQATEATKEEPSVFSRWLGLNEGAEAPGATPNDEPKS